MYRSQLTTNPSPTIGLVRRYMGNGGNVALIYSGAWEVITYASGERDYYLSDSAEAAVNYYAKQVGRVK